MQHLARLFTPYPTLFPIFYKKVMSVRTWYPVFWKCYHILPHLIIAYHTYHTLSSILERKVMSVITINLVSELYKMLPHFATSYDALWNLITLYLPFFIKKVMSMTTLNLVPRFLKMLSHLAISFYALSHLITLLPPSFIEQ